MPRQKKAPEMTFQEHIADFLVREHGYGVLEQSDITDTEQAHLRNQHERLRGGGLTDSTDMSRREAEFLSRHIKNVFGGAGAEPHGNHCNIRNGLTRA